MSVLLSSAAPRNPPGEEAREEPGRAIPALKPGVVHVWTLLPELEGGTEWSQLLSAAERDKAQRFRFPEHSARYVADHARMRLLLAAYLDSDPQRLPFIENRQGKPRMDWPDCRLRFNLSHTHGMTLLAVCLDAELGVDIERLRAIEDRQEIAAFHFSPREVAALEQEPEARRDLAFLRCWTRKEAYVKARGEGLSLPLDQFTVSLDERAALLDCQWDPQETSRWQMENVHPGAAHVAALVIEQGTWSLEHFHWPVSGSPAKGTGVTP